MERRNFLREITTKGMGLMALPYFEVPNMFKDVRMGVVVHSYGARWNSKIESQKFPAFTNAIELLEHCHKIGAGGIQTVVRGWAPDFSKKLRERREKLGLYLEGSIGTPSGPDEVAKFEQEVINAKEAGAVILRTVTSNGRRYEVWHSPKEVEDFKKNSITSLELAEPILKKHKVKLAVENHKDWRADELVAAMKHLSSEAIGVTLDFGNSISLIEDPMEVIEKLAPYVMTTHAKDMGVDEYPEGFLLSEVPLGKGLLDLPAIISTCKRHNPNVTFNLEMITRDPLEIPCLKKEFWSVFDGVQASEFARTLRMVKEKKYGSPLPRVSQLSPDERLAAEEENILKCLSFSKDKLGLV